MQTLRNHLRYVSFVMAIMMAFGSVWASSASAGMVGTGELLTEQRTDLDRQSLLNMLEQDEVKEKLAEMGVSQEQVEQRIQNLTPEELSAFEQQLRRLPLARALSGSSFCSCWCSSSPICCAPPISSRSSTVSGSAIAP